MIWLDPVKFTEHLHCDEIGQIDEELHWETWDDTSHQGENSQASLCFDKHYKF